MLSAEVIATIPTDKFTRRLNAIASPVNNRITCRWRKPRPFAINQLCDIDFCVLWKKNYNEKVVWIFLVAVIVSQGVNKSNESI